LEEKPRVAYRYRTLLAVAVTAALPFVAACGAVAGHVGRTVSVSSSTANPCPSGHTPAGTLTETGSSLLYPLFAAWATAYKNVTIRPEQTSSGTGILCASEGEVDIGASDAFLSSGNLVQHPDLLNIPLAISAQQVNYNLPTVPATQHVRLNGKVLAEMYDGQITNWDDPQIKDLNPGIALPSLAVRPLHRGEITGAGDTFLFTSYLSAVSPYWNTKYGYGTTVAWPSVPGAGAETGNTGMVDGCAASKGCVAYIGISYLSAAEGKGLGYAALENAAGKFVLPTTAGSLADAVTPFESAIPGNESISMVYGPAELNQQTAMGYPIVNFEYVIVPDYYPSGTTARAVKAFLHWAITTGNSPLYLGGTIMFQPLPPEVASLAETQIVRIR
jgi:phosphate transport system substrate-binding protein